MKTFIKDPDDDLDYLFYWADKDAGTNIVGDNGWLQGDTIAASTMIVPAGLTESKPSTNASDTATVWLAGGDLGSSYVVTNRITTAGGRSRDDSIKIIVRPR